MSTKNIKPIIEEKHYRVLTEQAKVAHVIAFAHSGLTLGQYSAKHNISPTRLRDWARLYADKGTTRKQSRAVMSLAQAIIDRERAEGGKNGPI